MAADKFNRNYELIVETTDGGSLTIQPPFTIEMDIQRSYFSSTHTSTIRIYNLARNNRMLVRKDAQAFWDTRQVVLRAGYGKNMPTIASGQIMRAWSERQGVNYITTIESFDAGNAWFNGITNKSFPAGTSYKNIMESLIGDLPGVTVGGIGDFPGQITKGESYSGNTGELLSSNFGGNFFIDNGVAYILNDNEVVAGQVLIISSDSGLLGTPVREDTRVFFDMIFEPGFFIGQQVQVESITTDNGDINGVHKVIELHHRGMLSDSVAGEAITTVGLIPPLASSGLVSVGR